jgi:hypothetical protein
MVESDPHQLQARHGKSMVKARMNHGLWGIASAT